MNSDRSLSQAVQVQDQGLPLRLPVLLAGVNQAVRVVLTFHRGDNRIDVAAKMSLSLCMFIVVSFGNVIASKRKHLHGLTLLKLASVFYLLHKPLVFF